MQDTPSPSARPIIAWSDILLVGHEQIDADHRRLFEIADRLHAGIREAGKDMLVRDVMGELMDYTLTHFAREEAMMKAAGFPGLQDHRFEHELITYRLRNLHRDADSGREGLAGQLEVFLDRWLARHILTSDAQIAIALRDAQAAHSAG
ncbi:bacteriohemerythrin [Noviherbaspirillum sp. ST9]|uniref:bacteriohemerythrin n=1 Tax=Noviherbaspirillum sp. ST9 TaxID=3401606 RepID=UPI003B587516